MMTEAGPNRSGRFPLPVVVSGATGGDGAFGKERLRRLWGFVRPYSGRGGILLAILLASTAMALAYPLFVKLLVDRVLLAREARLLAPVVLGMFAFAVLRFVLGGVSGYLHTWITGRLLLDMRLHLYRHLESLPLSFFARTRVGEMVSRLNSDIAEVQSVATGALLALSTNLLVLFGTSAILIYLNWRLFVLSGLLAPGAILLVRGLRPRVRRIARLLREMNADLAHHVIETLSAIKVVKAYGAERQEARRFLRKNRALLREMLRFQILSSLSEGGIGVLIAASSLVVLWYGGSLVLAGALSLGGLIAFEVYQARVFGPLQGLTDLYLRVQRGRAAIDRVFEFLEVPVPPEEQGGRDIPPLRGEIAFHDVWYAYPSGPDILRGVTFTIPEGAVAALLGQTGAGKTTIVDLLFRFATPRAGEVLVDGHDLRGIRRRSLIDQMAYVSQEPVLFHATIEENIHYGRPGASRAEVERAAQAAGLEEMIARLPDGYETVVGERGTRLSGGERQRVALARAFLRDPRILILDEATSSLDLLSDRALQATLRRLMEGRTTIVVTHRLTWARQADLVIVLRGGRIVEVGPGRELLERGGLYRELAEAEGEELLLPFPPAEFPPTPFTPVPEEGA